MMNKLAPDLIDPSGKIVKHYVKVKPDAHVEEVLADIQEAARYCII